MKRSEMINNLSLFIVSNLEENHTCYDSCGDWTGFSAWRPIPGIDMAELLLNKLEELGMLPPINYQPGDYLDVNDCYWEKE